MGQEFPRILIEELTQIPLEKRYLQLIASCRSTIPEIKPQIFASTNPGGLGHAWVKKRFVDPAPPETPFKDPVSGRTRIYIPARVDDNPSLMDADPDYIKTLDALKDTDEELWKAWRLGDWNTFAGQYFREWNQELHICDQFTPLKENAIVGGMDWGRTHAFAFYLSVIKKLEYDKKEFYRAKIFLEVYGHDKTPKEWATIIKQKITGMGLTFGDIGWIRGDPAMFSKLSDNSMSISDQFKEHGIDILPASNERIGGWENMHNWLSIAPDGYPYLQIARNCVNAIETIPLQIHDENNVEDLEKQDGDDSSDSIRYMLKHLKWLDAKRGAVSRTGVGRKKASKDPRKLNWVQNWGKKK